MRREVSELLLVPVGLRVQFVVVFVVELSSDGLVDTPSRRVRPPECRVFT